MEHTVKRRVLVCLVVEIARIRQFEVPVDVQKRLSNIQLGAKTLFQSQAENPINGCQVVDSGVFVENRLADEKFAADRAQVIGLKLSELVRLCDVLDKIVYIGQRIIIGVHDQVEVDVEHYLVKSGDCLVGQGAVVEKLLIRCQPVAEQHGLLA